MNYSISEGKLSPMPPAASNARKAQFWESLFPDNCFCTLYGMLSLTVHSTIHKILCAHSVAWHLMPSLWRTMRKTLSTCYKNDLRFWPAFSSDRALHQKLVILSVKFGLVCMPTERHMLLCFVPWAFAKSFCSRILALFFKNSSNSIGISVGVLKL
jgi:hypothetical protein